MQQYAGLQAAILLMVRRSRSLTEKTLARTRYRFSRLVGSDMDVRATSMCNLRRVNICCV